jgi:hypothetical protein
MVFDRSTLKKHAQKGKFGIKTQKNEFDTSASAALRVQQDLLATRLKNTFRAAKGRFLLPQVYTIRGKQVTLYESAFKHLGIAHELDHTGEYAVDKTGFCPDLAFNNVNGDSPSLPLDYLGNNCILVSNEQSKTSIINPRYSFLERLLSEVDTFYSKTISSFSRSEAVIGSITNIIVEQGVERFLKEESYKEKDAVSVTITLSTPSNAISALEALIKGVKAIEEQPDTVTDLAKMQHLNETADSIKQIHKKLGDLHLPEDDSMNYDVSSFRYGDSNLELYYFKFEKPVFIFFAPGGGSSGDGLPEDYYDEEFIILNGNDRSKLINNMLDLNMVDFLVEYVESVRDSYIRKSGGLLSGFKAVTGASDSGLPQIWHDLNDVASVLRMSDPTEVAKHVADNKGAENLEIAYGNYVRSLDAGIKSYIVFPKSEKEDKLICDLISKCSESKSMKLYGNSSDFMAEFSSGSDEEKIAILKDIDKNMRFENQNNLLLNYWLHIRHNQVCQKAGITFSH